MTFSTIYDMINLYWSLLSVFSVLYNSHTISSIDISGDEISEKLINLLTIASMRNNSDEFIDIESKNLPKIEFRIQFNKINKDQKDAVKKFFYEPLIDCLSEPESRIIIGYPHRYQYITNGTVGVNIITKWTDEEILLRIDWINKRYIPNKNLPKVESMYIFKILEIYIDSSRKDKIAILKFLENRESKSDAIQTNIHTHVSSITQ